jgi:hypothetical protein
MYVLLYSMLETYPPLGFWFNHPEFASLDRFGVFESVFEVISHSKSHTYYLGAFSLDEGEVCLYATILTRIRIHWKSSAPTSTSSWRRGRGGSSWPLFSGAQEPVAMFEKLDCQNVTRGVSWKSTRGNWFIAHRELLINIWCKTVMPSYFCIEQ